MNHQTAEHVSEHIPELPNILGLMEHSLGHSRISDWLASWENVIFSWLIIAFLLLISWRVVKNLKSIPDRLQSAFELYMGGVDEFVCSLLGPRGRAHTPFIGTLFIYIFLSNLLGLIPLLKSPTASLSTTFALSLCVFGYVQYTAFRELGFLGVADHLMGQPRGILAFSIILPAMMLVLHLVAEMVRPLSLSLRLRTNIWGDDLLVALMTQMGWVSLPILFFITILALMTALVQSAVFTLLTTVYLAFIMKHPESEH